MSYQSLVLSKGRTVTIAARINTVDAGGSPVVTYSTSTTTAVAWLQTLSASEQDLYGAERGRMTYRAFFLPGVAVANTDRVTASIDSETRTFDVIAPAEKPGEMAAGPLKRVEVILQETFPRS